MYVYSEELYYYHPNQMIANMGQSDITHHLM